MTAAEQRVLVTGLGIAAPNGFGLGEYWAAVCGGSHGIGRISRFDPGQYPSTLAGEIKDFTAADHLPGRLLAQTDRMTQLSLVAAELAFEDAGIRPEDIPAFDMGVVTAGASGGFEFGQRELQALWSRGSQYVSAYQSFAWFYAVNTGQISIRNGMRGPGGVVVADQAGGLDAVARARRQVRRGTPVMMTGAVDASLCPWGWVAWMAGGTLSTSDDPQHAYLPFDARANGGVPGEGGALLVLEDAATAYERGAPTVYGEILGYGATFDPRPGSGREPGLRRAVELALQDAGTEADQIDVVYADAAAVPELDRVEAEVISKIFGPNGVPVTAPKTMTGRLNSGAGPLDVATALLSLRYGVIPPTVHTVLSSAYDIDLVGEPRAATLRTAVILARGRGGFNSAMVIRS
ncbi:ketosynthase chain-length factor [Streptomyces pimonensis]|uniref:Ketosynthase chain-length factor n=1 Tax=Streptomyces pimonensis TaxID=2860288 RepID=A0ABV4J6K8_9ACTN